MEGNLSLFVFTKVLRRNETLPVSVLGRHIYDIIAGSRLSIDSTGTVDGEEILHQWRDVVNIP